MRLLPLALISLSLIESTLGARELMTCAIGNTRTITGNPPPSFEFVGGEVVAPNTAAVECDRFGVVRHAIESGPMAKENRLAFCQSAFVAKPWRDLFPGDGIGDGLRAFADQIQLAFAGAVAHSCEVVGDHPQAGHAAQAIVPNEGIVTVHLC